MTENSIRYDNNTDVSAKIAELTKDGPAIIMIDWDRCGYCKATHEFLETDPAKRAATTTVHSFEISNTTMRDFVKANLGDGKIFSKLDNGGLAVNDPTSGTQMRFGTPTFLFLKQGGEYAGAHMGGIMNMEAYQALQAKFKAATSVGKQTRLDVTPVDTLAAPAFAAAEVSKSAARAA